MRAGYFHPEVLRADELGAADRLRVQEIQRLLDEGNQSGVRDLARHEPRLFRLKLGSDHGPQFIEPSTRPDEAGRIHQTSGTFAMQALDRGDLGLLQALFEAGVHPDDRSIFLRYGVLASPRAATSPGLMALAIGYGADPDGAAVYARPSQDAVVEPVVHRLQYQYELRRKGITSGSFAPQVLLLLLQAGARPLEAPGYLGREALLEHVRQSLPQPTLLWADEVRMQRAIHLARLPQTTGAAAPRRRTMGA